MHSFIGSLEYGYHSTPGMVTPHTPHLVWLWQKLAACRGEHSQQLLKGSEGLALREPDCRVRVWRASESLPIRIQPLRSQ